MRLDCRDISFKFPQSEEDLFSDLTFSIDRPGFHALFGPSGVGKTSLARLFYGAIADYDGKIATQDLNTRLYAYNLERVPGWSSIEKHLHRVTPAGRHSVADELVTFFGMASCMHKRYPQLSLGQKNRINLIRYLLQDFDMLIMDESLANVDEATRGKILLKIKEMFPDKMLIYISHNVMEVARFCDRILVLRGVGKSPQATMVQGLDQCMDTRARHEDLDAAMLEIMNAA